MNPIPNDTKIDDEMVRKQVLESSLKGVGEFLNSYKDKALEYVYESELQASLYGEIKSYLKKRCKLNLDNWVVFSKNSPKTLNAPCLIHCEQWCGDKAIDIAVWDPEENSQEYYNLKNLLLLIEVKYCKGAKWAVEAVIKDYNKLKSLKLKNHSKKLALVFTVADTESIKIELEKSKKFPKFVDDIHKILNEKQLRENPTQALVVCRDSVIEILSQQENR